MGKSEAGDQSATQTFSLLDMDANFTLQAYIL